MKCKNCTLRYIPDTCEDCGEEIEQEKQEEKYISQKHIREILGDHFFNAKQVEKILKVKFDGDIPEIRITEKQALFAKEHGHMVALLPSTTLLQFREKFPNLFYSKKDAWYEKEDFAKETTPLEWVEMSSNPISDTSSKTYEEEKEILAKYIREKGDFHPKYIAQVAQMILLARSLNKKMLEVEYTWTQARTSDGYLVGFGRADSGGAGVRSWDPDGRDVDLRALFSRQLV